MSAFVVSKAHIDALVTLAVIGPQLSDEHWHGPFRWISAPDAHWSDPSYMGEASHETADAIGSMLWRENVASIHGRYPDTDPANEIPSEHGYPGPADFQPEETLTYTWPRIEVHTRGYSRLTAVQGLKAISCYEYQSCEHDGWETSEAKRFCDALRHALCSMVDGYSEAAWAL